METAPASDKRIGFSVLFGILGLLGAVVMYVAAMGGDQLASGWGFALAMAAGALAIAALHLYD
ncbi:DUF7525 family protein [Natronomonas sp. EA1]|uniref:DUF7525 family protein n=1 Tax=Natronomonas sp. EA1 TaxID=3421655 RepID=UPI003EBC74F9